jgi:hypothetical protein
MRAKNLRQVLGHGAALSPVFLAAYAWPQAPFDGSAESSAPTHGALKFCQKVQPCN